jgi:dUTPase
MNINVIVLDNLGDLPLPAYATTQIFRGLRIAQMVISKFEQINRNLVEELTPTDCGASGFGSTGQ